MNLKDHLWKAFHRTTDKSVDAARDKMLFKAAYDRIVELENALEPFANMTHQEDLEMARRVYKNGR